MSSMNLYRPVHSASMDKEERKRARKAQRKAEKKAAKAERKKQADEKSSSSDPATGRSPSMMEKTVQLMGAAIGGTSRNSLEIGARRSGSILGSASMDLSARLHAAPQRSFEARKSFEQVDSARSLTSYRVSQNQSPSTYVVNTTTITASKNETEVGRDGRTNSGIRSYEGIERSHSGNRISLVASAHTSPRTIETVDTLADSYRKCETTIDGHHVVTTNQTFTDRVIAIPEIVQREIQDEAYIAVPRRVVEKEKVIKVKEVVEIPEIQYVDDYITEHVVQNVRRVVEKPVIIENKVEHIVHVDEIEEVVLEVPDITYEDVVVTKDVHVPTVVEREVTVERLVPQHHDEIIENVNYVYKDREVRRNIPVPVEASITQRFIAPRIESVKKDRKYKVLLPEFSERAVWATCVTKEGEETLETINNRLDQLAGSSLCEVEKLFCDVKASDLTTDEWFSKATALDNSQNLPYMGVERVHFNTPQLLADESFESKARITKTNQKGGKRTLANLCKPRHSSVQSIGNISTSPGVVTALNPQFIQVATGSEGQIAHTTIAPDVSYAKRTIVN